MAPTTAPSRPTLSDWLCAETIRHAEDQRGSLLDDPGALAAGRAAGGSLQRRIVARARALGGPALAEAAEGLHAAALVAALLPLLLGLVSGAAAGSFVLGASREVDVLRALGALLILPTVFLLGWALLLALSWRARGPGLLGGLFRLVLGRLSGRLAAGSWRRQLPRAVGGLLMVPGIRRWAPALLTHGFWALYFAGALAVIGFAFLVSQYDLSWGTTLLPEETVISIVQSAGWLPHALLGAPLPDRELVLASRAGVTTGVARETWAWYLLASAFLYGLLPRLLLLALSSWRLAAALRGLQLDTGELGYQKLAALLGGTESSEKPYLATAAPLPEPGRAPLAPQPYSGAPILLGIELERAEADWPPTLPGMRLRVLGRIDDRAQRANALQTLAALKPPPSRLVALCSLLRTPDRGTAQLLVELAQAARAPLVLLLAEGGQHVRRGGDLAQRVDAWHRLAAQVGAAPLVLDPDQPDTAALEQLHRLLFPQHPA
jgi:hypothetical protein